MSTEIFYFAIEIQDANGVHVPYAVRVSEPEIIAALRASKPWREIQRPAYARIKKARALAQLHAERRSQHPQRIARYGIPIRARSQRKSSRHAVGQRLLSRTA